MVPPTIHWQQPTPNTPASLGSAPSCCTHTLCSTGTWSKCTVSLQTPIARVTTSTFETSAFRDPLTRKIYGNFVNKTKHLFQEGPWKQALVWKKPVAYCGYNRYNCLKRFLVSQMGWWTSPKLIQHQKPLLSLFYPFTVFTVCSLTKQGKNTASQILQATTFCEQKQNVKPSYFHISNKNNVTVCCISVEAHVQEVLQIIYSGPLIHMCHSMQPRLIRSLNKLGQHRGNPLSFALITKSSSTLTMLHNSSKRPLPRRLSW